MPAVSNIIVAITKVTACQRMENANRIAYLGEQVPAAFARFAFFSFYGKIPAFQEHEILQPVGK